SKALLGFPIAQHNLLLDRDFDRSNETQRHQRLCWVSLSLNPTYYCIEISIVGWVEVTKPNDIEGFVGFPYRSTQPTR
ncbi:hypothetical protein, partial [Aerosakkonema funiforme]|uniref:hypothetical protein n=1 Tax=Aerosakkonema funiforme TaxID=1246630 RepID=UPI0035B6AEF1